MKTCDYILKEMKSFVKNFPQTRVRYEHDIVAHTHFIEIVPNYLDDDDYLQWEGVFFDKFIYQYPDENICFISDNAIVGLDNVDFELYGAEFVDTVQFDAIKALLKQTKVNKKNRNHYSDTLI